MFKLNTRINQLIKLFIFLFALGFTNSLNAQFFYGVQQTFGKNRVVYEKFKWNYYRMPQYDVFYYQFGTNNAQYVLTYVDDELKELSKFFKLNFDQRFQIIVFNSLSDLKQSNLNSNDDASYNTGGVTSLQGNKMFLHGTGKREDLKIQLKAGLTQILLNYLIAGNNFKKSLETYKNLSLPTWFSDGLIMYLSSEKSPEVEARIRDGLKTERLHSFNSFSEKNAKILGYSIWDYIAHKYGREIIPNIVYMTYSYNDVEYGFEKTLGIDYKQIRKDYLKFYSEYYGIDFKDEIDDLDNEIAKSRNEERIFNVSISNDRNKIAYTTNKLGLYSIYLVDLNTKKRKKIYKGGYRIPQNEDLSYPLIQWMPNNRDLAIIDEKRGKVILNILNTENKEILTRTFSSFEKVNSISFSESGDKMVFSAISNGFTDIFVYNLKTSFYENITGDSFDDLDPVFRKGDSQIVFSSNRYGDKINRSKNFAIGKNFFDLYVYEKGSIKLHNITNTKNISEFKPRVLSNLESSYLAFDNKNIQNVYAFTQDSVISHIDTAIYYRPVFKNYLLSKNQHNSIINYDYNKESDQGSELIYHDDRYRVSIVDNIKDSLSKMEKINAYDFQTQEDSSDYKAIVDQGKPNLELDLNNYRFEDRTYSYFGVNHTWETYNLKSKSDSTFPEMEVISTDELRKFRRIYRNIYFATELKTQVDQSNDNLDYQIFTGGPVLMNSGINALFEITLADVFNNYSLTGGFRTDFNPKAGLSLSPNSEFKIQFDDRKSRINKSYQYYRRSQFGYSDAANFYSFRAITNKLQYKLTYPFNPVMSVSAAVALRRDKQIVLSVDDISLNYPDSIQDYFTLRLSHVYDNTINFDVNLYRGLRTKFFVELYQGIDNGRNTMVNLGLDLRQYTRIHRNIIWANRFATGTSIGSERLAYYLGGVDNSFNPQFDYTLQPSPDINYGFQTLMTNMRGFYQNIRHGTSFMLFNTELRMPIIQYFFESPLTWSMLRHFQVVPFFDVGTAWTGLTPWSEDNNIYNKQVVSGPITISIDSQKEPFVYGYGVGLRTKLFGYFMRFDWSWGVDTGVRLPGRFDFSLNLDF